MIIVSFKINLKGRTILQIVERGIDMRKYREASTDLLSPLNAGEEYISIICQALFQMLSNT